VTQLGTYNGVLRDSVNGTTRSFSYSGTGDFTASVNTTSQTVTAGQSASYVVTFTSSGGFTGTITPIAQNFSPQVPGATGSWSSQTVTVPSNSSVQATFTLQTNSSTTAGTYTNILLSGKNGGFQRAANQVSLTVNPPTVALTGGISPTNPVVGVTDVTFSGTASPNATVTDTETAPDGTVSVFTFAANSAGNYTSTGTFKVTQLGTYNGVLRDSVNGTTRSFSYSGTGDFTASVNTTNQTVTKGQSASYTVTFSSVSGFSGTVVPAALNWSQVPGATGSWSPLQVTVPAGGSVQAVFTIQTSSSTTAGTYSNITLQGANGSVTHAASPASLTVGGTSGPASGTITANPATCQVTPPATTCAISLVWTLQNTTSGELTYTDALGNNIVVGPLSGPGSNQPFQIQGPPQKYVFYLWDYTGGSKGAQLASVPVAATGPNTASTSSVGVSPSRNTPGSTFTIYGSGLAVGQATVYVQAPSAQGNPVAPVTVGADGTFNYPYTTQPSNANGLYTAWAVDSSGKKSSAGTFTLAQATPASIPTCQSNTTTSGCNGDPINTATGNYTYQRTDLTMSGRGLPFAFTRTYNSQNGTPGPMGAGWTHSYMASFVQNSDSSITIRTPDGQVLIFDPVGGSYISRFNNVYSTLQSPSSGVFVLTTKNQVSYRFYSGQLTAVSDRNGNTIQLTYSNGILTVITDTVGRPFAVSADPAGRITQILGPAGRSLQYQYDAAGNLVAFTDSNGGTFTYTYDGAHEMLTAVDPVGNTFLTNTYDGSGHVATQADGMGNRWTYSYDANTLITTITDPNGKVSSHLHDSNFQLLRATDTLGKNEQYQYDSLGNRISVQDRDGNTTRLNYDSNGNVLAATDAQANTQAAAYDAQSNPLTRTDALGNQATFSYDSKGNLVASVDPLGNKVTFTNNSNGQLTSKTDALGRTTQYSYDTSGNLVQLIDQLGNKTTYTYDSLGRRTSTTDANGFTTNTAYDANDNIVSVTDALGNKTQYSYDGNNNRTKMTDPRGKATAYAYDGNQKLVTTTDALGSKVTNTYDKLRNLASILDQRGNATRYSYDSENRVTGTTDPLGKTTSYAYDASGNRIQVTDPLGNVTAYGYDSLNRQVSVKDSLGNQTASAYDAAGHVLKKTDPAGNVTTYSYDAVGRQTSILDAAGGQVSFQYDKGGNRTQITDVRGKVTQFAYDGMNRLLTTTDPLGNAVKNQYDGVGNLVQVTDGNGNSKAYQYDGNRRQTNVTYSTGGSVQFTYDANGNRTKMVDLIGTSTYSYDDLNRLQNYTNPAGSALSFTYDSASNRTALQYPGSKSVQYLYDADNRVSKVTDWTSLAVSYSYDAAGRISGVGYSNGLTSQYTYDFVGQNLSIQHNTGGTAIYSEATTWSPNGTPTSSNISGLTAPGLASENTTYGYNDANELASSTYGSSAFDKNGNLTIQPGFGGPTTFAYDLNNRATSISGPSGSATMKYFGDGKLGELDSAGASHRYLIDPTASGNRILAELDSTGAMQIAYVYGPRGMISQLSGGQAYLYLHNLQGSTIALLDSSGSIKNSYRYDPFGQKLPSSTEQMVNSFAFLGSFSVPSTIQYSLMTYRVYDARQGRFYGVDPARYASDLSLSPFAYARQSPLRFMDPSGLCSVSGLFDYTSNCYSLADNTTLATTASAVVDTGRAVGNFALGTADALSASAQAAYGNFFGTASSAADSFASFNNSSKDLLAATTNIILAFQGKGAVQPSQVQGILDPITQSIANIPGASSVLPYVSAAKQLYDIYGFLGGADGLKSLLSGEAGANLLFGNDPKQVAAAYDAFSQLATLRADVPDLGNQLAGITSQLANVFSQYTGHK
jgi:RHS repeat-associated protein